MSDRLTKVQRRLLVAVLCAPLLGLVGVIAAEAFPDERIADHLVDAREEGILRTQSGRPATELGTRAQSPTECLALSVGVGDQPGRNHVTTAIVNPTYRWCRGLNRNLDVYETTGELPGGNTYLRYWHGYSVISRPALAVFGLAGTRWIAFGLAAAAVGGMAIAVGRRFGLGATAILVAPALLTTDTLIGGVTVAVAMGTAVAWAGGWMTFGMVSRRPDWKTTALVAALAGVLCAYLDLMTTMPGAYALVVVGAALAVIAANGVAALQTGWRVVASAAIGWAAGLAWMWGSKWVIAAIAVGIDEVVDNVKSRVELHMIREGELDPSRYRGLTEALGTWWDKPLTPWIVFATLVVLVVAAVRARPSVRTVSSAAICGVIIALPVLGWYIALNNHSQVHYWLVYRSLPIAFGAVSVLLYLALTVPRADVTTPGVAERSEQRTNESVAEPEATSEVSVPTGASSS